MKSATTALSATSRRQWASRSLNGSMRCSRNGAASPTIREGFRDVEGLRFCSEAPWAKSNFWLMSVLIDPDEYGESRTEVMDRLDGAGVDSRPFFFPIPSLPPYRESRHDALATSEHLHATGICIPSSSTLEDADQDRVIALLRGR